MESYPIIEVPLVAYLKDKFPGIPVVTRVPKDRPREFIRLTRVGGVVRDQITDRPWVAFEAWSYSEYTAAVLGQRLHAFVHALKQSQEGDAWFRGLTEIGGLQYFPDSVSGQDGYQFSVQFNVRGIVL